MFAYPQVRKIYDKAFKEKAVELSYDRTNVSELARELGITAPSFINGVKNSRNLEKEVFLEKEI
nr:transposase [Flavobacterium kingsejongi]